MIELKPCPFCGENIKRYSIKAGPYGVERLDVDCCMDFTIRSDPHLFADGAIAVVGMNAIEKWNRRTQQEEAYVYYDDNMLLKQE